MKEKHKKAYMECAEAFSKCSNATRLKVGCVIVRDNRIISVGYNAHPEHIHDACELPDGTTDPRLRHAEKNAFMGLLKSGISSVGAQIFCTHSCCLYCAIDIVDAGIVKFTYKDYYRSLEGIKYLIDCGIEVEQIQ